MSKRFAAVPALLFSSVVALHGASQLSDTFTNWIDHPAIAYRTRQASDPVAALARDIKDKKVELAFEGRAGYLRSTLDALRIPIESQIAVFSTGSLQGQRISTVNPRVIFFNDSVSVAWVRGGFIEVASQDPVQGIVFYAMDNDPGDKPQFTRRQDCLQCHYSRATVGIPGMVDQGYGQLAVDHRTAVAQRWGGWYVTGEPSSLRHMGNHVARSATADTTPAPWRSLDERFDTSGYLSARSDIVALLVFNHQMRGMNLLGRIGWEARVAEFTPAQGGAVGLRPPTALSETPVPLPEAARELVDYFLFIDEAPFAARVRGTAGFAERFAADGPRDRRGRSLRDLDLDTRLLRYPCSYLVYSPAFDALPASAKEAIYRRLWEILSGGDRDPRYQRLTQVDRRAIIEILRDTKPDLPSFFE